MFRQLARQLVGLIPVVGILPKVAVAYGGTWAIGAPWCCGPPKAAPPRSGTLRTFGRDELERGREVAHDLTTRGPAGVAQASGRWDRLNTHVPGLAAGPKPGPGGRRPPRRPLPPRLAARRSLIAATARFCGS